MDRDQIEQIIHSVTGDPEVGVVHDITPALVDALDAALNQEDPPPPALDVATRTTRILEVDETR